MISGFTFNHPVKELLEDAATGGIWERWYPVVVQCPPIHVILYSSTAWSVLSIYGENVGKTNETYINEKLSL